MQLNKLFIFLLLLPCFAFAGDEKTAKANVAKELAICAAYFFIGSEVAKKNNDIDLAKSIKSTADAALITSIKLSDKEIATSTLKLAIKDHQRLINNDSNNIVILIRKYKKLCKELVASPKKRLDYWVSK